VLVNEMVAVPGPPSLAFAILKLTSLLSRLAKVADAMKENPAGYHYFLALYCYFYFQALPKH